MREYAGFDSADRAMWEGYRLPLCWVVMTEEDEDLKGESYGNC